MKTIFVNQCPNCKSPGTLKRDWKNQQFYKKTQTLRCSHCKTAFINDQNLSFLDRVFSRVFTWFDERIG